jgi:hypothetical protein
MQPYCRSKLSHLSNKIPVAEKPPQNAALDISADRLRVESEKISGSVITESEVSPRDTSGPMKVAEFIKDYKDILTQQELAEAQKQTLIHYY